MKTPLTPRFVLASAIGACLAASLLVLPPLAAQTDGDGSIDAKGPPAAAHPDDADPVVIHIPEQEQQAALDYWTPERIKATMASTGLDLTGAGDGTAADGAPSGTADPASGDQAVTPDQVEPAGPNEFPSVGWLFFRYNGQDTHCTANAVAALTQAVVATAAHCVNTPHNAPPARIEYLTFLLNFNRGTWIGRFPVRNVHLVQGWALRGEAGFDFAFLSVAHEDDGSRPGDRAELTPVRFSPPPLAGAFYLYGYPVAIDDGEAKIRCTGAGHPFPDPAPGPRMRIVNDCPGFSGGASGGPAIQTFGDSYAQTGNVVRSNPSTHAVAYTYWEAAAHGAWDRAQHDQ